MQDDELPDEVGDTMDPAATERLAKRWGEWAAHDLKFFLDPLMAATGLTRTEALLYLISERLSQIADVGVTVRLFARHDVVEHPPEDENDEWKKR
jgi:hypothetical protein